MKVFGTEMHIVTFVIIIIQLAILFIFLMDSLRETDKRKKSIIRFSVFTALLLAYFVASGLMPDPAIPLAINTQMIIAYGIPIVAILYYVYYVYKEFGIKPNKLFSLRILVPILTATFVLLYIIPLLVTDNQLFAKTTFLSIAIALAFAFLVVISRQLMRLYNTSVDFARKHHRNRIASGYIALLSLIALPVVVAFGDYQAIESLIVFFGYLVLAVALMRDNIYRANKREQLLTKLGYYGDAHEHYKIRAMEFFNDINLTDREIEIANSILDGLSFKVIGENLFIAEGTVSKHASNIYNKCGVGHKEDFVEKLKTLVAGPS